MNAERIIGIIVALGFVFSLGWVAGDRAQREVAEKTATTLKNYPKCLESSKPLQCAVDAPKVEALEKYLNELQKK